MPNLVIRAQNIEVNTFTSMAQNHSVEANEGSGMIRI